MLDIFSISIFFLRFVKLFNRIMAKKVVKKSKTTPIQKKARRGRPAKKSALPIESVESKETDSNPASATKRRRGRPRKSTTASDISVPPIKKRGRGRPRKSNKVETTIPKRPVGRPPKTDAGIKSAQSLSMNLKDVQALIEFVSKVGVSEVELETQGVKIVIKTPLGAAVQTFAQAPVQVAVPQMMPTQSPIASSQPAVSDATKSGGVDESKYVTIKSPMIGTFYRKSAPDKPVFVNVGDDVSPGKVLCIIEAMKLFNEIEAEISGKIVKVLVDDSSPVEYDQPLFLVDPS